MRTVAEVAAKARIDELRKRLKIERAKLRRQEIEVAYLAEMINACKQEQYQLELQAQEH